MIYSILLLHCSRPACILHINTNIAVGADSISARPYLTLCMNIGFTHTGGYGIRPYKRKFSLKIRAPLCMNIGFTHTGGYGIRPYKRKFNRNCKFINALTADWATSRRPRRLGREPVALEANLFKYPSSLRAKRSNPGTELTGKYSKTEISQTRLLRRYASRNDEEGVFE